MIGIERGHRDADRGACCGRTRGAQTKIRSVAGRVEQHRDIVPDIAATVIGSYQIGITVTIHICGSNRPGIVADWEIRSLLKGAVHISQKNTDTLAAYYADRDVKIAVFVKIGGRQ